MPTLEPVIEDALKQRYGVQERRLLRYCSNVGGNGPDYLSGITHNKNGWKATVDMEVTHREIDPLSQTYWVFVTRSYRANSLRQFQN